MSRASQYNSNWESFWNTFKTNWTFPPAADPQFIRSFRSQQVTGGNFSYSGRTQDFLLAAIQSLPRLEEGKFGAETSVVHVGDAIDVNWLKVNSSRSNAEPRNVIMNCVVCSKGKEGGAIFNACGNYTDNAVSFYPNATQLVPAGYSTTLTRLHNTLSLPPRAVGLCYMSLTDIDGLGQSFDDTYPFPVSAAAVTPHLRFSATNPTGVADPSIGLTQQPTVAPTPVVENAKDKPSVGIIVGVVIAVFVFTCLVVAIIWFVWTRTRRTRAVKRVDTPGTEEGVELQRVQRGGVQRRIDRDDEGEAPPAYHESLQHQVVSEHDPNARETRYA